MPRGPSETRPGYMLYKQLRKALSESDMAHRVEVKAAECLSVCPRPCGIALSRRGAWTYLFGDQAPSETVEDIMACVSTYVEHSDGYMTRDMRPKALRGSILGRIPALKGA